MEQVNAVAEFQEIVPLPMCVVNGNGTVVSANSFIGDVFIYDDIVGGSIFALTGIKFEKLLKTAETEENIYLERNEKVFKVVPSLVQELDNEMMYIYFIDVTHEFQLEKKCDEDKICIARVHIDNYEELIANTPADRQMSLVSKIDKTMSLRLTSHLIQK